MTVSRTIGSTVETSMRGDSVCLIGLDLGTSAIKGVLVDADGHVLARADVPTTPRHPHDGWVETDPEELSLIHI